MTSAAKISGIFARDSCIAAVCIRRAIAAPLPLNTPVSRPARVSASCASKLPPARIGLSLSATPPLHAAAISVSWPAFSSTLSVARIASTPAGNASTGAAASIARAGLAAHAATTALPSNIERRDMLGSIMSNNPPPTGWPVVPVGRDHNRFIVPTLDTA